MNDKNLIDSSFDVLIKVGNKRRLFANDNTDTNPFRDVKFLNKIHDFNQYYKEFYAHSSILLKNTKSKYFYNAIIPERKHDTLNNTFTVNSNEKLSTIHPCDEKKRKDNVKVIILELPNIEPSIFEVILEYIYRGNLDVVDFTKQKMISILFASSFLNLKPLITHLFTNNFFGTLHSLNASYFSSNLNDNELDQRKCIVDQLCLEYTSNLFISDVYLSFHKGFIYDILSSNNLIMNELEVWTKLIKWGIHNSNLSPKNSSLASNALPNEMIKGFSNKQLAALEGMIKDFISLIRFHHIGLDDYFKEIGKPFKNILPKGLNKAIFKYHMKKEIFKNMIILSARYYQQIDSTIIVGEQTALLAKWIKECKSSNVDHNFLTLEELVKEEKQFKFKLLLRGSKHGFGIGTFHKICDGIDNTICIIKVKNSGEIIGGYNPFSWQSYYRFGFQTYPYRGYNVPCSSSFLFSLNNNNIRHDNHSTKNILSKVKKNHISEAIYYSQINGPKFGRHDLYLMNKSMSYNRSIHDNKEKLVGYCKQYSYTQQIIDKPFLEIEDYEIFQVIIDV